MVTIKYKEEDKEELELQFPDDMPFIMGFYYKGEQLVMSFGHGEGLDEHVGEFCKLLKSCGVESENKKGVEMAEIYVSREEKRKIEEIVRKGDKAKRQLDRYMRELADKRRDNLQLMKNIRKNRG